MRERPTTWTVTLEGGESEILVSDDDDEDNDVDQPSFRGCGKPRKHWDGSKVEVKQPPKVRTMMTLWMMMMEATTRMATNTTMMALSKQ